MTMKRLVLLFASVLIGLNTASGAELTHQKNGNDLKKIKRNRYAQPIVFMERDVEFLIFPDGSFDFNTNAVVRYNDSRYKYNSRRPNINVSYRGPNANIQYTNTRINSGVTISYNSHGNVRRIGNVYLNYDRKGRITQVGSIFIDYDRGKHSNLSSVGGLRVNYNKWGQIINLHGQVNRFNNNCNLCGTLSCDINHQHKNKNYDKYWDNDYYHKQNRKLKKHKK